VLVPPVRETPAESPVVDEVPMSSASVQKTLAVPAFGSAEQIQPVTILVSSAQAPPIPVTPIPVTPIPVTPVQESPVQESPVAVVPVEDAAVPPAAVQKTAPVAPVSAVPDPVAPVRGTTFQVVSEEETSNPTESVQEELTHAARTESSPGATPVEESEVHIPIPRTTPTAVVPPVKSNVVVDSVPATAVDEPGPAEPVTPEVINGFAALSLNEYVLKAVVDGGYEQPTPIQSEIIPLVLAGRDVLAQSQTGSGKTAAFALPILSRIDTSKHASRKPQVLVLAPTRELAIQVSGSFATYGACLPGFTVTTIYGGQSYDSQFRQLKRGVNVVVGTPGRVIDHIKRGTLDLSELRCLVLDEADEMLNMGFLDDVRFVLEKIPSERQIALFSATLPAPIRTIAEQYLDNPARITIKQKTMTADSIRQRAIFVTPRNKIDALKRLLEAEETDGVIIFTKTRDATVTVADQLKREGLATVALNGDMPQRVRERTIEQLKAGQLDILVATDVAARGLDVTRVSHVINYDAPNDNDSYIHRVGRTGRAGRTGEAIIFLSKSQRGRLRQIERATRQTIEVIDLPTAEDINSARVKRFVQQIADTAADQDLKVFEAMIERFAGESEIPMLKIAAALAHLGQQGRPFFVEELPQGRKDRREFNEDRGHNNSRFENGGRPSRSDHGDRRPRQGDPSSGPVESGMDRYRIAVGWQDGVKPGNIVGAVANEGGIDGEAIGAIRIYSTYSTIDLPEGMPAQVRQALQTTRVAGRPLQLRPYREEPQSAQRPDDRPGTKPRSGKPSGPKRSGPGKRPFNKKFRKSGKPGNNASKNNRNGNSGGSA
ncbi:MAG: DEAD/DEAH box helicase, partial [Planctomycetaceae bacterium]